MSWPLACFTLVAVVLAVGWLAYERSRPSARTVALVATLAALAALGRDAFAAFDEIKPITAMTFVVGYTLGPLPGFVVGAIGMLVSNMMLGQGPYTPWQMAAWGLVGLLGALVGRLSRERLRRLPLALCCAFAAFVAKEIMNLYTWTIGAAHTPAAFFANAGTALPFDAVDVVSTLIFGLIFGPELARLLARARERTHVDWRQAGTIAPLALAAMLLVLAQPQQARAVPARSAPVSSGPARAGRADAAATAQRDIALGIGYLASAQKPDGGFGTMAGAQSTELYSGWSATGLAAAGMPPLTLESDGHTLADLLRAQAGTLHELGSIERTMIALQACGLPADKLAGVNLLQRLLAERRPDGSFADEATHTAFAIFALLAVSRSAYVSEIEAAGRWLARQQNEDGGFSFGERGDPSDVDDTAAVVQGLIAARVGERGAIARAIAYLRQAENRDGGFPEQRGESSNAQSTAWAIQALRAAHHPVGFEGREPGEDTPIGYLERLVAPSGSVHYAPGVTEAPVWVTAEALAAFAGTPFPIDPVQGAAKMLAPVANAADQLLTALTRSAP
ncbi:MAG TPA: prenyltransferase/squalene oxidase repeat-containing protein [Solirubrobacteraceae bacterium]|jgi:energy-coupling factor transport system substrate-specific component